MIAKAFLLAASALSLGFLPRALIAAEWYVDASVPESGDGTTREMAFKTIQQAIDSASGGDTVIVRAGVYEENISFRGKEITVRSEDPDDFAVVAATVIDGQELGPVVTFSSGEGPSAVLRGFTITNGKSDWGGGIYCDNSSPTIINNVIVSNEAWIGGGIYTHNSQAVVANNVIARNSSSNNMGGIYYNQSSLKIVNNTIVDNVGFAIFCDYMCSATISNCIFVGNGSDLYSCSAVYSCLRGGDPLAGNTWAWPHFVAPDKNDYRLQSWSPCVDAGDPASDFSREPEPNGGRIDMGAYGNTPNAVPASLDVDADGLPDDWEMRWFHDLSQAADGNPDGDSRTNIEELRRGSNPTTPSFIYVDCAATKEPDGLSWETAFRHIQEGIDAAWDKDVVIVAPGHYRECINFRGKAITLRSKDPQDPGIVASTIIDAEGSLSTVTFDSGEGPDSVLTGFTVAGGRCGVVCEDRCSPLIVSNLFRGNDRAIQCSGLECSPVIKENTFTENSYGVWAYYGTSPEIADNLITANSTGIWSNTESNISGNTITANRELGILCFGPCGATIVGNVVSNNRGGGITGGTDALTIAHNVITRNSGFGGVRMAVPSCTVADCVITDNSGNDAGAILYEGSGLLQITNCVIAGNSSAGGGGAICLKEQASIVVTNCTIADNPTGGIWCHPQAGIFIVNTVLWGNSPWQVSAPGVAPQIAYCDVQGGWPGDGNIDAAPLFDEGFHLRPGSPCIDAGTATNAPGADFEGEVRPYGTQVDIGADEYVDTDFDSLPDWWERKYFGSVSVSGPQDDPDGDGLTTLQEYQHGTNPALDADADGDGWSDAYEIFHATNVFHPDNPELTYYVNGTFGDDRYDGLAAFPEAIHGPKKTFQAAIDAAITGWDYTVLVAPGTYSGPGNRGIDFGGKEITVKSAEGAGNTVIDCERLGRGFHFHGGETPASVLDGFTVRSGSADYGGGICCKAKSSPTIINCAITGNNADYGGGISCDEQSNPGVINCILLSNSAKDGAGVQCLNQSSPRITNCMIAANQAQQRGGGIFCSGQSNATVTNCTVVGNMATSSGGGIFCSESSPALTNCILWGDTPDEVRAEQAELLLTCCDVQGGYLGEGNIAHDPLFVNPSRGDYHLRSGSPCIDAGTNDVPDLPRVDLDGEYRPFGSRLDIGADEHVDADVDGLPDFWEITHFAMLWMGPEDDPDADGLPNADELLFSADPNNPDTDGDGLSDGEEVNTYHSDPMETDSDGDGLTDGEEAITYGTNPCSVDTDGDQMPDAWEVEHKLDPLRNDGGEDPDNDGLPNAGEFLHLADPQNSDTDADGLNDGMEVDTYGTSPTSADTDGDKMPDGWEVANGLNAPVNDARGDADGDGLTNFQEYQRATDPKNEDTDADGLSDGKEVYAHGTDPLKPDTDGDGKSDGEEVFARTDPRDASSLFWIMEIISMPQGTVIRWTAAYGKTYQCYFSTDLANWQPIGGAITLLSFDSSLSLFDWETPGLGSRFYKVEVVR